MSLNESELASASQTNSLRLFTTQPNFGKCSLITWIGVSMSQKYLPKQLRQLVFRRRNLAFAPRRTKEVAYKTLVQPKLEYAASIWNPHSKLQINQIEKVHRYPGSGVVLDCIDS